LIQEFLINGRLSKSGDLKAVCDYKVRGAVFVIVYAKSGKMPSLLLSQDYSAISRHFPFKAEKNLTRFKSEKFADVVE
jgi:hypothetical protein